MPLRSTKFKPLLDVREGSWCAVFRASAVMAINFDKRRIIIGSPQPCTTQNRRWGPILRKIPQKCIYEKKKQSKLMQSVK